MGCIVNLKYDIIFLNRNRGAITGDNFPLVKFIDCQLERRISPILFIFQNFNRGT